MKNSLSTNEFKIMQLLWKEGRPLFRPEIIDLTPERDWNPNSIHLILNNMIEKGVITVDGLARCGRGYGRTYVATVTNLEYAVDILKNVTPDMEPDTRLIGIVKMLLEDKPSANTVETLKKMLET